jgi:hypothetical protein
MFILDTQRAFHCEDSFYIALSFLPVQSPLGLRHLDADECLLPAPISFCPVAKNDFSLIESPVLQPLG